MSLFLQFAYPSMRKHASAGRLHSTAPVNSMQASARVAIQAPSIPLIPKEKFKENMVIWSFKAQRQMLAKVRHCAATLALVIMAIAPCSRGECACDICNDTSSIGPWGGTVELNMVCEDGGYIYLHMLQIESIAHLKCTWWYHQVHSRFVILTLMWRCPSRMHTTDTTGRPTGGKRTRVTTSRTCPSALPWI